MRRADRPYDPAKPDGGRYRLSEELPFVYAMIWGFCVVGAVMAAYLLGKAYAPSSGFTEFMSVLVQEVFLWVGVGALILFVLCVILGWVGDYSPLPRDMLEDGVLSSRPVGFLAGAGLAILASAYAAKTIEAMFPEPEPKTVVEQVTEGAAGALGKLKSWWSE